jgi:SAM-dependent methyltransferase
LPDYHADRDRAESFGALAEEYDRLRPTIPPELVDDLVALRPERVLDVGCGTGKAARALMARGLVVLGVEFDERMAAVARRHGVEVEVGAFEDWDPRGRTFDLIVASDSWHWIDPERGWRKIGEVLAPGATVVRVWNQFVVASPLKEVFDEVYARIAPEVAPVVPAARAADDPRAENQTYRWPASYGADDYVALAATYSLALTLEPDRRAELSRALHAAIMAAGGVVRGEYQTLVSRSRAAPR